MNRFAYAGVVLIGLVACLSSGCAVPQPRGKGKLDLVTDKQHKWPYWIYRPEEYMAQMKRGVKTPVHPATKNGKWPLVVSFHGMKPFDNCYPQALEWQEEADRYGYIMIAPQLRTSDLFMQFPLKDPNLPYVREDVKTSLAAIREVIAGMPIDRNRVLSTSWSSGGYMAHYMVNRYPDLFSCLAVRQSNFSAEMLNPRNISRYRDMPVGVFWTSNDFVICQVESRKAVEWYRRNGFKDFSWGIFQGLGHERTPQSAAALFAIQCGIRPRTPARFPDLGESHGRLRQAVAYAQRASSRPLPGSELVNLKVARKDASDKDLPDRPSNPTGNQRPLPTKTKAGGNGNGKLSTGVTDNRPGSGSPSRPPRRSPIRTDAQAAKPTPAPPIVRDYTSTGNQTPRRPNSVTRSQATPSNGARDVWKTSAKGSGGSTTAAPYKPLPTRQKNLRETPKRQLVVPPKRTPNKRATPREPSKYEAKPATEKTAARPPKPRNPAPIAPTPSSPKPDLSKSGADTAGKQPPQKGLTGGKSLTRAPQRPSIPVPKRTTLAQGRPPLPKRSTVRPPTKSTESVGRQPTSPGRTTGAQVSVYTNVSVGTSPCYVSFRADLPVGVSPTKADFLWTDNGIPICNGQTGEKILVSPGEHRIEVLVITNDNRELRGGRKVTVFRRLTNQRGPSRQYGTHR